MHAVKVFGDAGSAPSQASSALWTGSPKAMGTSQRPAVASMSLGGPGQSYGMKSAIDRTVSSGVTLVVATGNENSDACGFKPAYIPSAIIVGAIDERDKRADYSNYGSCVDIFALGSNIVSAMHSGRLDATTAMSGTSMACPHVAGAPALLLSANSSMTPATVLAKLLETSQVGPDQSDLQEPERRAEQAARRLQTHRRRRRRRNPTAQPAADNAGTDTVTGTDAINEHMVPVLC
mmetsp:Transcript_60796/g.199086  ORF Transcript_60796/g.199086 Transcript_60796/m.199086 type:complete len:235 (+) Transcript_60796:865-1569(+)